VGGKWMRPDIFSIVCGDRTRSNGLKLEQRKFCTNMWKNFLMIRVTEHWEQVTQRDSGVSFYGDVQALAGCLSMWGRLLWRLVTDHSGLKNVWAPKWFTLRQEMAQALSGGFAQEQWALQSPGTSFCFIKAAWPALLFWGQRAATLICSLLAAWFFSTMHQGKTTKCIFHGKQHFTPGTLQWILKIEYLSSTQTSPFSSVKFCI